MGGMCGSKAATCKNNPCPEAGLGQCGREQAPSHNGIPAGLEIEAQQKARLIIDQPGFFTAPEKTYFFKP